MNAKCQPYEIIRDGLAEKIPFFVTDLSTAYHSAAKVSRGFALIDGRHVLKVDEIGPKIMKASPLSLADAHRGACWTKRCYGGRDLSRNRR